MFFELLILKTLKHLIHQGDTIMATIQDLDAAISSLEQAETTAAATITSALNDLVAKVAAAGTPIDVAPEVARIQAVATSLGTLGTTASSDDPGAATTAPTS